MKESFFTTCVHKSEPWVQMFDIKNLKANLMKGVIYYFWYFSSCVKKWTVNDKYKNRREKSLFFLRLHVLRLVDPSNSICFFGFLKLITEASYAKFYIFLTFAIINMALIKYCKWRHCLLLRGFGFGCF